jgi:hypothetical protein
MSSEERILRRLRELREREEELGTQLESVRREWLNLIAEGRRKNVSITAMAEASGYTRKHVHTMLKRVSN